MTRLSSEAAVRPDRAAAAAPRSERIAGATNRSSCGTTRRGLEHAGPWADHSSRGSSARPGSFARDLAVLRPGRLSYADGTALQNDLVTKRRAGEIPDTLVLLEHDAVVTLGRAADRTHVLLEGERLARSGIELCETGRGGDVTVHSPGQVVGYPILALEGERRDTHEYLRALEEVMIRASADFGVEGSRVDGLTGVWVGADKLGAIGVRLNSGWITSHGFAFNVSNDLSLFDVIVPCGIRGRGVTSLSRLLGTEVAACDVMDSMEIHFREVFRLADTGCLP